MLLSASGEAPPSKRKKERKEKPGSKEMSTASAATVSSVGFASVPQQLLSQKRLGVGPLDHGVREAM